MVHVIMIRPKDLFVDLIRGKPLRVTILFEPFKRLSVYIYIYLFIYLFMVSYLPLFIDVSLFVRGNFASRRKIIGINVS